MPASLPKPVSGGGKPPPTGRIGPTTTTQTTTTPSGGPLKPGPPTNPAWAAGGGQGNSTQTSLTSAEEALQRIFNLPKFTWPPPWYSGFWPPASAASTVRNWWFNILGDLSGFPYNADTFGIAFVALLLQSADQDLPLVPLPIQFMIQVLDSGGKVVGALSGQATEPNVVFNVPGAYSQDQEYTVSLAYVLPDGGQYTASIGPIPGTELDSLSTTPSVILQITDYPAIGYATITLVYPDGSPGAGLQVVMSIYIPASDGTPAQGVDVGASVETDANGVAALVDPFESFDVGQTYQVIINVLDASGGTLTAPTFNVSGATLQGGTFAETISVPAPGDTEAHGTARLNTLQRISYDYTCTNQEGDVIASSSGDLGASDSVELPTPSAFEPTDKLTFKVVATNLSPGGTQGTKTAAQTVSGADFTANGVSLQIDFGSGGGSHGGH